MAKSISKNLVLSLLRTLMSLLFPLITFPYVSRVLMPEGLGKVNFAMSVVSYFSVIAAMGISTYGIREIAKVRENRYKLNKTFSSLFTINLISTFFSYLLLVFLMIFIKRFELYRKLILICSINMLFVTLSFEWVYTAFEDFEYITIRSFIFQVISLVFLFTFVKKEDDVNIYALIGVFSTVGTGICNTFNIRKYVSIVKISLRDIFVHIKPNLIFFASSVANSVYTILDTSMLGIIAGDYEVGIYSVATKINRMVLTLVTTIGAVLLPRLSFYHEKEKEKYFDLLYKSFSLTVGISVPCTIGLEILSKNIVLLLSGESFLDAVPVMRVINLIIVIISIGNFLGVQIIIPECLERKSMCVIFTAAIINFSLNILLINNYGAIGAAIASVCAELYVMICNMFICRKYIRCIKIIKVFLRYLVIGLIMGIGVFSITLVIRNNFLSLVIGVMVGIIVYLICLIICKDDIIKIIKSKLKKITR